MSIKFVIASDQHIACGTAPGSAAALSVSFWAIPASLSYQIPVDKLPSTGTAGWTVKLRNNGDLWFRVGSEADYSDLQVSSVYSAGVLVHIVCTFSGGTSKLYVDSVLVGTEPGITQTVNDVVTVFQIGRSSVVRTDEKFDGPLDDVRVYDRELLLPEVETIFARRGSDEIVHGLVSRWKMLEGYPTQVVSGAGVVKDHAGANDGTPTNSPTWAESVISGRRKRRAS